MNSKIDSSVSQLKEAMVEIDTGILSDIFNCIREIFKATIDCSRYSAPTLRFGSHFGTKSSSA